MKTGFLVLCFLILLSSALICPVKCRPLRSLQDETRVSSGKDQTVPSDSGTKVRVSASLDTNNGKTSKKIVRKLAIRLNAGPSPRGPGH